MIDVIGEKIGELNLLQHVDKNVFEVLLYVILFKKVLVLIKID